MTPELFRQLSLVDWDFIANDDGASSGVHWYPGTFVPALPAALIEALSAPNDVVFDPYGGVGTTALAALTRGRAAICCDMNPVAGLSSFVGVCLLAMRLEVPELFDAVFLEVARMLEPAREQSTFDFNNLSKQKAVDRYVSRISDRSATQVYAAIIKDTPRSTMLKQWYDRKTLARILSLVHSIETSRSAEFSRLVALAMISAVARQLSSQNKSWGHVADNVRPLTYSSKDVERAATQWLVRLSNRYRTIKPVLPLPSQRPFFFHRLHNWSTGAARISKKLKTPDANLLITSPPYGGAIDYILAQRLSLYLFGYSEEQILSLCQQEIGARRKRFQPTHVDTWASDLSVALDRQLALLAPASYAVFVMPHKDSGRDAGELALRRAMTDHGWDVGFAAHRSIRQAKARQSWTSIKRETILAFERKGGVAACS